MAAICSVTGPHSEEEKSKTHDTDPICRDLTKSLGMDHSMSSEKSSSSLDQTLKDKIPSNRIESNQSEPNPNSKLKTMIASKKEKLTDSTNDPSKAKSFEEIKEIAHKKGGRCCSPIYFNSRTAMEFECKQKHIFERTPFMIKQGSWCPTCGDPKIKYYNQIKEYVENKKGQLLSTEYINMHTKMDFQCENKHKFTVYPYFVLEGGWCAECSHKKKLTINEIQKTAESRGGICLSTIYSNNETKLDFQCGKGHFFKMDASHLNRGHWCSECAGQIVTLKDIQKLAENKKGVCISTEYINSKEKMKFKCENGHYFLTSKNQIQQGEWCPECNGNKKLTIDEMQEIAQSKKGKCLSKNYFNNSTNLKFECEKGHQFEATPSNIKHHDSWCPFCAKNAPLNIEKMKQKALENEGQCVSTEYKNNSTPLHFKCANGHDFYSKPMNIAAGTWCPECNSSKKGTIEEMQQLAINRGGKCLSSVYVDTHSKLEFICRKGHHFEKIPRDIRNNRWCTTCRNYTGERLTNELFKSIFKDDFRKVKPSWLLNDRGNRMELDGYNEKLKLAFEYQGEQHYEFVPHYHKTLEKLEIRKKDDELKLTLCQEHGIILIQVPYTVAFNELQNFIETEFEKLSGIKPPITQRLDYKRLNIYNGNQRTLLEFGIDDDSVDFHEDSYN